MDASVLRISKSCIRVLKFLDEKSDAEGIAIFWKNERDEFRIASHIETGAMISEITVRWTLRRLVKMSLLKRVSRAKYSVNRNYFGDTKKANVINFDILYGRLNGN